ncbi:MAG TPA: hypothetical protein PLB67_15275 [Candidatus Hydrogenedentes bacterium]|jgi:hypothetical protein|nr:hypothetical protein [Candidatus Hydrogenedentota bacterium]MDY0030926.1 hypothetical protein [FCB group bacterium]NLT59484.1 hypothetical protein [Candidatus Hydrogenedentota bacterium]HNV20703.1 hypothetical protein [Candidatus Hydrogenedentota bacterium]HNZ20348.1 hypothetical protein [Candidatus Hydrogenedentota bacterium]
MMDAIQRMRRERRVALLLFALFAFAALCVHWWSAPTAPDTPRPAPTETVE